MLPDDAKIILSEISGSSYFSFIYPFTCSSEIGLNFIIVHLDFIVLKKLDSFDPINIIFANSGGSSKVFNKQF